MNQQAKITKIEALREFRATLILYQQALSDSAEMLLMEMRRGVGWVETDRTAYWPARARQLDEDLVDAKNELEQCEARAVEDQRRSCYAEKKKVTAVKQKLESARQKIKLVRKWRGVIGKERDEFETRISHLRDYAEVDMPQAIAALQRMIDALDKYAAPGQLPSQSASPQTSARDQKPASTTTSDPSNSSDNPQ